MVPYRTLMYVFLKKIPLLVPNSSYILGTKRGILTNLSKVKEVVKAALNRFLIKVSYKLTRLN